jgi:UDP-N-acetylglucosamine acyltransferase
VSIHPSAIVAPGAVVPASCTVGPFSTIGPEVVLGEDCTLVSHVVLDGRTRIGARNIFYPFCSAGVSPQDLKYQGEPTETVLGDGNTVRESVTISRGTAGGGGVTRIGSNNLLMTQVHIGHDSHVGSHCILANAATLAGHVTIEDFVTLGAFCPVHQHCVVGAYSFIGGGTIVTQDVLPFSLTSARRENKAFGINKIGLERRGFSADRLAALQKAFRVILASKLNTSQALEKLRTLQNGNNDTNSAGNPGTNNAADDIALLILFIERSHRGVIK